MADLHDGGEVAFVLLVHAGLREDEPDPPFVVVVGGRLVVDLLDRLGGDALQVLLLLPGKPL